MTDVDYLNESVWCKVAVSPIEGVGVFAIRDIPKDTKISDYEGNIVSFTLTEEEFGQLLPEVRDLILDRTFFVEDMPLTFMSPNSVQVLQAYMNHSDTPNSDGWNTLRDIKKGEEITEDYRKFTKKPHSMMKDLMKKIK